MNTPLVSVVTATYNMAHFIEEAVESVLNQTYTNIQHIIIDDGSTDDTRKILEQYLGDPRVEYFFQENKGQTVAKNNGIKKAKGKYICFLDSDNIWELDKLQIQVDTFAEIDPKYKIIYTEQLYIDGEGKEILTPEIKRYAGRISANLLFENFVTFNTVMVKRECFEELGLMDENLQRSIDYELWLRFSTRYDFYYLPAMTAYYRHHEGQMSQDKERRFRVTLQIMNSFLQNNPGLIQQKVINKAWGHAFINRGRYKCNTAEYGEAIQFFIKAFTHVPFSIYLWKSIARMFAPWKRNAA